MRPCAELTAFIDDRAAQGAAQRAMINAREDWRSSDTVAQIVKDLNHYGAGQSFDKCSALGSVMLSYPAATRFVSRFLTLIAQSMAVQPLGHPCFWHSIEPGYTSLHMLHSERATLSMIVAEKSGGGGRSPALSATFSATERHEVILAGKATGEMLELEEGGGTQLVRKPCRFAAGQVTALPAWTTRSFAHIERPLICLRLSRRPAPMPLTRQIRLSDGALLHEAAGDPRDTRHELMSALLGKMGRDDAAPTLADLALKRGSDATRWQAIKSALALDTAAGFAALTEISESAADPLLQDARNLRAQLVDTYPVLADLEEA